MGKMHAEGVTLIELLMSLAVAAIVLAIGVPSFRNFVAVNDMSAAANDVVSALQLTRSEALKRRDTVTWCASENAKDPNPTCSPSADPGAGWIIFTDTDGDAAVDGDEIVIAGHAGLKPGIATNSAWNNGSGAPFYVAFDSVGRLIPQLPGAATGSLTDLQLCDERGDHDTGGGVAAGRWVEIEVTGRPQLNREYARVQGASNPLGGC